MRTVILRISVAAAGGWDTLRMGCLKMAWDTDVLKERHRSLNSSLGGLHVFEFQIIGIKLRASVRKETLYWDFAIQPMQREELRKGPCLLGGVG